MSNLKNCLKNETVYIQYIRRNNTIYEKQGNPAAGGMHKDAKWTLTVPVNAADETYKSVLTKDEFEYLQSILPDLDLKTSNKAFWRNQAVVLKKSGLHLDLSNPMHYIQYKVVEAWSNPAILGTDRTLVCDDISKVNKRSYYRFVIVKPTQVEEAKRLNVRNKAQAFIKLGSFSKSRNSLAYLVYLCTSENRISDVTERATDLEIYLSELIDRDPGMFVAAANREYFEYEALIYNCWVVGIIEQVKNDYMYEGSKLCSDGKNITATLNEAAIYISKPVQQKLKLELEAKLKEKLKG